MKGLQYFEEVCQRIDIFEEKRIKWNEMDGGGVTGFIGRCVVGGGTEMKEKRWRKPS